MVEGEAPLDGVEGLELLRRLEARPLSLGAEDSAAVAAAAAAAEGEAAAAGEAARVEVARARLQRQIGSLRQEVVVARGKADECRDFTSEVESRITQLQQAAKERRAELAAAKARAKQAEGHAEAAAWATQLPLGAVAAAQAAIEASPAPPSPPTVAAASAAETSAVAAVVAAASAGGDADSRFDAESILSDPLKGLKEERALLHRRLAELQQTRRDAETEVATLRKQLDALQSASTRDGGHDGGGDGGGGGEASADPPLPFEAGEAAEALPPSRHADTLRKAEAETGKLEMALRSRSRQRAAQRATLARLRNEMEAMRGQMARTLGQLQTMTDRAVSGLGYANSASGNGGIVPARAARA